MNAQGRIATRVLDGTRVADIVEAAACLRRGGLVAFPTETVYGLGADALNPEAVNRVFEAKGRPSDNPLIVHVNGLAAVPRFTMAIPAKARTLAEQVWPGPLTLVLERNDLVPDIVTAGLDTVALRMPRHPLTQRLLDMFDGGIVGPSANMSGRPSPTTAGHVLEDLAGSVEIILDGGPTTYGMESTVVDCTVEPPAILRLGALAQEEVERMIGVLQRPDASLGKRSPGTRHRHYAPRARVLIVPQLDLARMNDAVEECRRNRYRARALTHSPGMPDVVDENIQHVRLASVEVLAHRLYEIFRECDNGGIEAIIIEGMPERGIGAALMDRLRRASEPGSAQ